jgi:hypothetical protein
MSVLHTLAAGYTPGTGRLVPTVAALVGLAAVIAGATALTRRRRGRALAAVAAALVSVVVGGVHAATAAGGLGTGNGLAGAWVAVGLGAIGLILGGLALLASRRHAPVR